jgi:biopolymer transport protein ExbD
VFLLIVFFVLTYQVQPDLSRISLPETLIRAEVPEEVALISIAPPDKGEVIRVSSGREMSMPVGSDEELASFVTTVVAEPTPRPFVIKADRRAHYRQVDRVLEALKAGGARQIFLLSEQRLVAPDHGG